MMAGLRTSGIGLMVLAVGLMVLSGCQTSGPASGGSWRLHGVEPVEGEAILFAPGVISTEAFELNATFSPDGREFYFTRANQDWSEMTILMSRWSGGSWSRPEALPFNNDYINADPALSHDGKRLFFASKRDPRGRTKEDFDLWYVDRNGTSWGEPIDLGRLNTEHDEVCPIPFDDNTLYFTSRRPDGIGMYDIYRTQWQGSGYQQPELLDPPVNSLLTEVDATLSPDGTLLFFAGHGRADSHGKGDIYVCFKRNGFWSSPVNLGEPVNSEGMELCPKLAPDGRTLFFASTRTLPERQGSKRYGGQSDIYLVDLATLPVMLEQGWSPPKR